MATTVSQQISTPQPSSRLRSVADHVSPSNNGTGAAKEEKIEAPGGTPAVLSKVELDYGMEPGLSNKWDGTTCWCKSCRFSDSTKLGLD